MSHGLTDVSTFTASVVVADPGQPVLANDLEVACQPLANRTRWLGDRGTVAYDLVVGSSDLPLATVVDGTTWEDIAEIAAIDVTGVAVGDAIEVTFTGSVRITGSPPSEACDLRIAVSEDGLTFAAIAGARQTVLSTVNLTQHPVTIVTHHVVTAGLSGTSALFKIQGRKQADATATEMAVMGTYTFRTCHVQAAAMTAP